MAAMVAAEGPVAGVAVITSPSIVETHLTRFRMVPRAACFLQRLPKIQNTDPTRLVVPRSKFFTMCFGAAPNHDGSHNKYGRRENSHRLRIAEIICAGGLKARG